MLENKDRRILAELQRDSRLTNQELADKVGMSTSATWRRVKSLEDAGVIERGKQGRQRLYALKPSVPMRAAEWITSWASEAVDPTARAAWADQPYATMRNATPPKARKKK